MKVILTVQIFSKASARVWRASCDLCGLHVVPGEGLVLELRC